VLLDLDGKVSNSYKIYSIPHSLLINEQGEIVKSKLGVMTKEEIINFIGK